MRSVADSLTDHVGDIQAQLEELKELQYTSQDSGMKFKQIESVSGHVDFRNSATMAGEVCMITNYFVPDHKRPAICLPHIEFEPNGYRFEIYHDYKSDYYNVSIYNSSNEYLGYMDVWAMYHRRGTTDGSYAWQTVVYKWANREFDIKFNITLRATDSGSHSVRVEEHRMEW